MTRAKSRVAIVAIIVLTASAAASVAAVSFSIRDTSESAIPDYVDDSGQLILDKVPDLVPIAGRGDVGVAGYSYKEDVYREFFRPELLANVPPGGLPAELEAPIPVYATSAGVELIGYFYTEIGYVSLEEASEPGFSLVDLQDQNRSEVVEVFEDGQRS